MKEVEATYGADWNKIEELSIPLSISHAIRKLNLPTSQSTVDIHIPGSTYGHEGESDYCWLARTLPDHVTNVKISLIMGSPYYHDGPDEKLRPYNKYDEGEENSQAGKETLSGKFNPRSRLCKKHELIAGIQIELACFEEFYYPNKAIERFKRKPDLVVMVNPGFPLPIRRSWDLTLRELLENKIDVLVLALLYKELPFDGKLIAASNGAEVKDLFNVPNPKEVLGFSEPFQLKYTLDQLGVHHTSVYKNPFPYVYAGNAPIILDKTASHKSQVGIMFKGLEKGVVSELELHKALEVGKGGHKLIGETAASYRGKHEDEDGDDEDSDDADGADTEGGVDEDAAQIDPGMVDNVKSSFKLPVTKAFNQATLDWAHSLSLILRKKGANKRHNSKRITDNMEFLKQLAGKGGKFETPQHHKDHEPMEVNEWIKFCKIFTC